MHASIYYLMILFLAINPDQLFYDSKSDFKTDVVGLNNSNDKLEMIKTVKGFLHWYKKNYTKANSFGFTYQDRNGNFQVSTTQGLEYLKFLKSSGFISQKYVDVWLKYFMDKAQYLKENPQNEGPPEGFEFDLVLITQEPELVFKEIEKMTFTVTEKKGDKAILQINGLGYNIDLVKESGKWMIEYIATENYD